MKREFKFLEHFQVGQELVQELQNNQLRYIHLKLVRRRNDAMYNLLVER